MLDTYVGGVGTFPKGHKFDLALDILQHIPEDSYKMTCAPWDEHKDAKAIELPAANNKAKDLKVRAEQFQAKADAAKEKAYQLHRETNIKADEARKASAAAKGATKKYAKKKAYQLLCDARRKILEADKMSFLTKAAAVDVNIKQFEADSAKVEAKAAEAEARKQAEEKAKAEAEAKARKQAEEKAKAEAEAKAKKEAEEKAKASAEARAKAEAELNAKADAGLEDVTGKLGLAGQAEVRDE
jgi:hypothetical protein